MDKGKRVEALRRQLAQYQGNREMTRCIRAMLREAERG